MYIVILGCGRVGVELANLLSLERHDVVVVDKQPEAFARLGDAFNGLTVTGNGVFTRVLQDSGIERADIFCALTNSDNINIMASQVARGIFKGAAEIELMLQVFDVVGKAIFSRWHKGVFLPRALVVFICVLVDRPLH